MLETLVKILQNDWPSPEIMLEDDGCLCLDWHGIGQVESVSVSIWPDGAISWAGMTINEVSSHSADYGDFKRWMDVHIL